MKKPKKPKTNIEAQEEVVAALWQFARENRLFGEHEATDATTGMSINLDAVGKARERILAAFGYESVSIQ